MLKRITDKLFLSSPLTRPEQFPELNEAKVKYIVQVGNIPNRPFLEAYGFTVCDPLWIDNGQRPVETLWEAIYPFLQQGLDDPEFNLCSSCIGGPRRSSSVIYLALRMLEVEPEGALQFLKLVDSSLSPIYAPYIEEYLELKKSGSTMVVGYA